MPTRLVNICPGSDFSIFNMPFWCDVQYDPTSPELWIEFSSLWAWPNLDPFNSDPDINWPLVDQAHSIVLYDWFHAERQLTDHQINWIKKIANQKKLTWITINKKSIPGINTVHFDYYWNRTKRAFLDKQLFHRLTDIENFLLYPMHFKPRSHLFMNYHYRDEEFREIIQTWLKCNYTGFVGNAKNNCILRSNVGITTETESLKTHTSPPAKEYYEDSYVTCVVESQHFGTKSCIATEKTYDNIIQGRGVINFAPQGLYKCLVTDGWRLPTYINWGWNDIADDRQRLLAYLTELNKLFSLDGNAVHKWFVSNRDCWIHNQNMLTTKKYDVIDLAILN
jgi:hypothetical protein